MMTYLHFLSVFSLVSGSVPMHRCSDAVSISGTFHTPAPNIYCLPLRTHFSNVGRTLHHSRRGVKGAVETKKKQKMNICLAYVGYVWDSHSGSHDYCHFLGPPLWTSGQSSWL
jgi:hypothetical protein